MTHIWKRSISLLLALVMVFGMVPTVAFAEEEYSEEQTFVEEPVAEEPVEEPVAEEPVAEEPVEEEPAAEEPAAEEFFEEQESVEVLAQQFVADEEAMTLDASGDIDGYIWLDGGLVNNTDKVQDYILANGLSTMIREALGKSSSWAVTFDYRYEYMGVSDIAVVSMDAPSLTMQPQEYAAWQYLAEQIPDDNDFLFTLKKGETKESYVVAIRSINRLNVDITEADQTIAAEAYDAAAVAAVKDTFANSVKVTYDNKNGNEDIIPVSVVTVEAESVTEAEWPKDGATKVVDPFVTAVVWDSMDGTSCSDDTAALTLTDTTPVYTVVYAMSYSGGGDMRSEPLPAGAKTPTFEEITGQAVPTREYYTFVKWHRDVADYIDAADAVNSFISYQAVWAPVNDVNDNDRADEEELFKVIFQDNFGGAAFADIVYELNAGQDTVIPNDPADYDGWKFVEWTPAVSEKVQATADDSATVYVAKWTKDHRVHFMMHDGSKRVIEVQDGQKTFGQRWTYKDKVSGNAWYYANVTGSYTDADGNPVAEADRVEFKFATTPVTKDLYLVCDWNPDLNGNGKVDGTPEDPVEHHVWLDPDGNVIKEIRCPDEMAASLAVYPDYKPTGYKVTWLIEFTGSATTGCIKTTYTAKHIPDANGNDVDDAEETITITTAGNGTVEVGPSTVVAKADGAYIYDSNNAYTRRIVITAKPVVNNRVSETYVSDILVDGVSVPFTYNSDYSVTYTVADAQGIANVKVVFADAKLTTANETLIYVAGKTQATTESIYKTAVSAPEYNANNIESLKYLARVAAPKAVDVSDIREIIADYELPSSLEGLVSIDQFNNLKNKALAKIDERAPGGTFDVTLNEVWLNVGEEISSLSMEKVISDAKNEMMEAVMANPYSAVEDMDKVFDDFTLTINTKARAAECHPFGYNIGTNDTVQETLEIIYADERMRIVDQTAKIKLKDPRTATKITVSDMTVDFGADVSPAALLAHAKLTDINGNKISGLYLDGDYSNLTPGMTHTIYLKYDGTFDGVNGYKENSASFKVTINKSVVTIAVNNVVSDNADTIADQARPQIKNKDGDILDISDITGVHVIAGYDMTNASALKFEDGEITGVEAYAWIKMSENAKNMLSIQEKDYSLSELKTLINNNKDSLNAVMDASQLDQVMDILDQLDAKAEVSLKVRFTDDPYPKNPGVYLNMVVAFDDLSVEINGKNNAYGVIAFHPTLYIPNHGINLSYGSDTGHKLDIPSEAANKALTVTRTSDNKVLNADEYSIYYIGITGDGNAYMSTQTPTADGMYVAAATDLSTSGKTISTDCALVAIGMEQGKLTIDHLTIVKEDPAISYEPTIKVNEGAAVTIISGTAGINDPSADMTYEDMLEKFYGTVHMEIPDALYEKLSAGWERVFNKKMPKSADRDKLLEALKNVKEKNTELVDKTLGKFDSIAGYVDEAMNYVNATYDYLIKIVEKIPAGLTVSISNERQTYSAAGVYAYIGVVTDPAFTPDVGAGLLVIENEEAFELTPTVVPYDGNEKLPELTDEIKREKLFVIRQGNTFNFLLDHELEKAFVKKLEEMAGKDIPEGEYFTVTSDELINLAGTRSEDVANFLVKYAKDKAAEKIGEKFKGYPKRILDSAMNVLENHLFPAATDFLQNKIESMDIMGKGAKIAINAPGPKEVGTYQVYAVSYGVAVDETTLTIVPPTKVELDGQLVYKRNEQNEVIEQTQKIKVYDTTDPNNLVEVDPADYTVTGNKGTNAGSYTLTVTFQNGYTGTVELAWTIAKANITSVEATDVEYDGTEKSPTLIVKAGDMILNADEYEITGTPSATNPGEYPVIVSAKSNSNFAGQAVTTWKITDYVCWNMETSKYYDDVCLGLAEAKNGETVQMLKDDIRGNDLMWAKEGVTLDLNAKTVEADYVIFVNGSDIIDNSTSNEGLLIANDQITLGVDNDQVPIYDEDLGGYVFAVYQIQTPVYRHDTANDKIRIEFTAYIETKNGFYQKYFADGVDDNNLSIAVQGTWVKGDGRITQNFEYVEECVIDVVTAPGYKLRYYLELTNVSEYLKNDDITLTGTIQSTVNGAIAKGAPQTTPKTVASN